MVKKTKSPSKAVAKSKSKAISKPAAGPFKKAIEKGSLKVSNNLMDHFKENEKYLKK